MRSKILGTSNAPSQGTPQFGSPMMAGGALNNSEIFFHTMPVAGVISNLSLKPAVAPGVGRSRSITLRKNSVDVMTATVSDANTLATNTGLVSVAVGDLISVRHDPAGTPAAALCPWCMDFKGNSNFQSVLLGSSTLNATGLGYIPVQGATVFNASAPANETLVSASGTISNLFVAMSAALVSGTRTFTLRLNGVNTALAATVTAGNSTASDTSNSVAVVAGDRIVIQTGGSAVAETWVATGMLFTATTDTESTISCGAANSPSTSAANYQPIAGSAGGWQTTEAAGQHVINACTIRRIDVRLTTAPSGVKQWQFNVKVNGGYVGLEALIAGAATTGAALIDVPVATGDLITLESFPTGTPTATGRIEWSIITVQGNPATGRGFGVLMN